MKLIYNRLIKIGETMGKYGEVASKAANMLISNKSSDPVEAWDISVKEVFPNSISSQKKGCPRSTFLGLCEEEYILNVSKGKYTRSVKNKIYAIEGLSLLKANPSMTELELWKKVIDDKDKKYNYQMDVLKSLWDNDLINKKNISILEQQ